MLQRTPPSFDPSVWEFLGPLAAGARLVVPVPGDERDSACLIRHIVRHQVTVLQVVPSLLDVLLDEPDVQACRSLKHVFCGGEPLRAVLRDRFFDRLPGVELHNLYGPTEAAIDATCWTCRRNGASAVVPIGHPVANVQVYLLDAQQRPVPIGTSGELCIGGAGLARGYLNRPELTAEKFIAHPFDDRSGARLFKTGDLARRLPDGAIEFLGRMDEQVKIRGHRVEPGEIETVLMRHPSVREAVVVHREDVPGDCRLIAHVILENGQEVTGDALRAYAGERLPAFMVPTGFVITPSLPRLPNGKVDRRAIAGRDHGFSGRKRAHVAPRNEVESQLVQIWEDLLESGPVGVTDDFFELGGHSLMAMRLMACIKQAFGQELPVASLVATATVEHLADLLRRRTGFDSRSPLVALQPRGGAPPFFCVHPSSGSILCYRELAHSMGNDRPFYALRAPSLDGTADPPARIEDMAAEYLKEVLAIQDAGPYFLGGWSMGGIVAYEMACRLQAEDQQVALLAMLDSPPPVRAENGEEDDSARLISFVESLGLAPDHLTASIDGYGQLKQEEQLGLLLDQARRSGALAADIDFSQLRRHLDVHTAHMRALRHYRPGPFAGRISVFQTAEESGSITPDAGNGWEQLAAGGMIRYVVPGHHHSMLREPGVHVLARQLRSLLQHAPSEAPTSSGVSY